MERPPSGPAHVATVSFLASRAAPTGGFWVALAGGVALARVAQRRGLRHGYGASLAAMLESVAIMGPARVGVPFTQAITAPLLGRFEARGVGWAFQWLGCGAIRLVNNSLATAFFIFVTGLDAYAGTYERFGDWVGVDIGTGGALLLTALGLVAWAAFASAVQVTVYRRGLSRWPDGEAEPEAPEEPPRATVHPQRFDPRAVALAAAMAFGLLLASTDWVLLGAAAAWLALAWITCRPDRQFVPTGLLLTGVLALTVFAFSLGGGLGLELALRRASRAGLLVLVATWLRAAAGADGLREVSRRALGRLRRVPAMDEAARTLDEIGSEGRLLAAGRALAERMRGVRRRPLPVLDAVLDWVSHEAARFRAGVPAPVGPLAARAPDGLLVALAAAPAAALLT
jgi:hypothetical protein